MTLILWTKGPLYRVSTYFGHGGVVYILGATKFLLSTIGRINAILATFILSMWCGDRTPTHGEASRKIVLAHKMISTGGLITTPLALADRIIFPWPTCVLVKSTQACKL